MTEEQKDLKDLLLKDLCARLPYGVKVSTPDDVSRTITRMNIDRNLIEVGNYIDDVYVLSDIKPYLFPLSSMTDEQAKELFNIFGLVCPSTEEDYIKINECTGITFFLCQGFDVETHLDKLIDWLNKNHFDYRGLIPMDLANDCTNLNVY